MLYLYIMGLAGHTIVFAQFQAGFARCRATGYYLIHRFPDGHLHLGGFKTNISASKFVSVCAYRTAIVYINRYILRCGSAWMSWQQDFMFDLAN